jgi:hypothetical protein
VCGAVEDENRSNKKGRRERKRKTAGKKKRRETKRKSNMRNKWKG